MPEQTTQPELIISLSRDKVSLQFLAPGSTQNSGWQSSFRVKGNFSADEVSSALDQALLSNPDLIDQFACVHLLLLDRPSISLPSYLFQNGKAAEVAARHLRSRLGDRLSMDAASAHNMICYSIPDTTWQVIREYYHGVEKTHMNTLLWSALLDQPASHQDQPVMFVTLIQNVLFVLVSKNGKLIFSKTFEARNQHDAQYFIMACKKLIQPVASHWVYIQHSISEFTRPTDHFLPFEQEIELPSLPELLAKYRPCE